MNIRFFYSVLIFSLSVGAQERIPSFISTITVNQDGSLDVHEKITVISQGRSIRHGIVREFPTRYKDYAGTYYEVHFAIKSIQYDGKAADYHTQSESNGIKIYIGEKDTLIATGKHVYDITYTTNRQLGFFRDHDELYWNVTGTGWRLPIDYVQAEVLLPTTIPLSVLEIGGYTGYQGEKGNDYTYRIENDHIIFSTTEGLARNQGLTIVVSWPKGFIQEPPWYQKLYWFFQDNLVIAWLLLGLLILIALNIYCYVKARRLNKSGTVIPLFYPPEGLTPSCVGYMKAMGFSERFLGADIVYLAVRGFITISYQAGTWFGGTYTLIATESVVKNNAELTAYDRTLLTELFGHEDVQTGDEITINKKNAKTLQKVRALVLKYCTNEVGSNIRELKTILYIGYAVAILWLVTGIFMLPKMPLWVVIVFLYFLLSSLIVEWYRVYTLQGRKLEDEIDGFELYLTTTELERMKIIGTPPTKTPELYEKYLPYAMALGVEKQWTHQFASVFEKLEREGHPYAPIWYVGRPFRADYFGQEMASTFSNAIASASTPPGRSSGTGGRGSSGGGGGGGGGGGW